MSRYRDGGDPTPVNLYVGDRRYLRGDRRLIVTIWSCWLTACAVALTVAAP